eukprot:m.546476 g.546476  ORF g.546476 m.546476 type:complete len:104 (-) comp22155_c0_seq2:4444-4755(-)
MNLGNMHALLSLVTPPYPLLGTGCARTLVSNYISGCALKSEFGVPWATLYAVNRRCHVSSGLLNPDLHVHDVAHDAQVRAPRFYTPRECARMQDIFTVRILRT